MTFKQTLLILTLWTLAAVTGLTILFGESHPVSLEGRALQIEMNAYVQAFIAKLDMPYNILQWSALVLPHLTTDDVAMVYYWPTPERGNPVSTLAVFTFDAKRMLAMSSNLRKAIAGHEVGHVNLICQRIVPPNFDHLTDFEAVLAGFNYQVLNEGCADIVGAELTSYQEMLDMLLTIRKLFAEDGPNYVLNRRIQVIERVIEMENEHHE